MVASGIKPRSSNEGARGKRMFVIEKMIYDDFGEFWQ